LVLGVWFLIFWTSLYPHSKNIGRSTLRPYRNCFLFVSVLILLLATLLNLLALHHARRWHPDEAFYMTIARNAAVQGDWMLVSEPLDKPPLTYYINALSLKFLAVDSDMNGVLFLYVYKGEFAGRIPSLLMSVLLIAVVMAITSSLTHNNYAVLVGALLAALSPLRIVFAPTAFTDMPMLLFATLSLLLAIRNKWGWAGVWFMLSFAAKPQSVFYLPLFIVLGILNVYYEGKARLAPTYLFRFFIPIFIGGFFLWAWDAARVNMGAASFWALGQAYYTPTTITPLADYPARSSELWATVQYLFGHGSITAILLLIGVIITIRRREKFSLLLLVWLIGFFALHIIFTLNLFDRNLLLIVPVACVLVGISGGGRDVSRPYNANLDGRDTIYRVHFTPNLLFQIIILIGLTLGAFAAANGVYPIGGDDGRHDGIDELAAYLNGKPVATVIYDRWLDWELDYYMGEWTNKRRVYYPTPQELVEGALQLEETGVRYFVAPGSQNIAAWLDALTAAEFTISLDYESANFRVYALYPP
jgi:4-amino-4-deoxy-L-arabinose transferase-like glycosyltransferase